MRLFILAIVAGLGVLLGVALYVGQEIVNPGTPDSKVTARLAEQQEAIAVAEKNESSQNAGASEDGDTVDSVSDANVNAYKSQLRTAQYPAGTTAFDSSALRKQLPDIFQFPDQNTPPPPPIAIATVLTAKNGTPLPGSGGIGNSNGVGGSNGVGNSNVGLGSNSGTLRTGVSGSGFGNNTVALVPDAPTSSDPQSDLRADSPMIKNLAAPEHTPSVSTTNNPNVHVEVAPASEGRTARTRMIVSK